ncbi:MAG TPA: polyprenol monophosphomannose synthase [Bdellovibrionales bacterium]|nr:polyprenol monophosphomannose synthase [Bdellovibrionales bacterium]
MKTLVIIPTYNERENIAALVPAVRQATPNVEILVVDDNSPDGTQDIVRQMQATDPRLHLLGRAGKQGLGKAYIAGFKWGLERGFEALIEMDADFSHRPQDLKTLVATIPTCDFVVGSRWVKGGGTVNWSFLRKLISLGGSFYARQILGYPIRDWTGGFNAWKAGTLQKIGLDSVRSEGYSFQIELKYKASRLGLHGIEVPIRFEDRRAGQSKMSSRIVVEALYRVWGMRRLA